MEILTRLENLSEDELIAVKDRAGYLLKYGKKVSKKEQNDIELKKFYEVIRDVLQRKFNSEFMHHAIFKKMPMYTVYRKNFKYLKQFMEDNLENRDSTTVQKFYITSVKLIIDYLETYQIVISLSTIIKNMDKVPGLLNQAYPLYIENGLLNVVFNYQMRI